jgi:predicted nucleic acid-binding protein
MAHYGIDMKAKVYIETSIPSYLTAKPSNDIRVLANQSYTREWWERCRHKYDLFISEFVFAEISQGDVKASALRIKSVKDLPELEVTSDVKKLAALLISEGSIPANSEVDAFHVAVAAVNGMDYILTWNCAHIANATIRVKIEAICRKHRYEPPIICTPQELMEE